MKPGKQTQANVPIRSWHTALLEQGLEVHSFTLDSQLLPVQPGGQAHLYVVSEVLRQLPVLRHGLLAHTSMLVAQVRPVQLGRHEQV